MCVCVHASVHVCVCLFLYLCALFYSLCVSIISGKAGQVGTNFNTLHRIQFLNQARAGRSWFLENAFVREVSVCACLSVCVRPRAIKNYSHEIKSE